VLHWKTALICTAVGIGLGVSIARFGPDFSTRASARAPAADGNLPVSFVTNPIVPSDINQSENELQHLTDW
jgi:hypothetical protein